MLRAARLFFCGVVMSGVVMSVALRATAHEALDHSHAPNDGAAVTSAVRSGAGIGVYESIPNWCKLPEGKAIVGPTHGGIVVDKAGLVYFSMDSGDNGLVVYKADGTFVKAIGKGLAGMHGLAINTEDGKEFIYAAHLKGKQAVKLTLEGEVVLTIPFPAESGKYMNNENQPDKGKYSPTGIAVGPNGDIYVADGYGQNWVHQFDKTGKYLKSFGGPGAEPGKFKTCHGIALDTRGEKPLLLVCDRANRRLQHFDLEGNFVAVITEGLRLPCSVSIHGDRVAVAELEARVTILDGKNQVVSHLGDNPDRKQWANYGVDPSAWAEGVFTAPHGVSFDADGNLYVMDWNKSGRLSKLMWIKPEATASSDGR
jgi:sugar lactone lactonase YvrE